MGFFAAIKRGWYMSKLSFSVVKKDPELLVYVAFSGIMSAMALAAMAVPQVLSMEWAVDAEGASTPAGLAYYFLCYMGLSIIVVFWNSAIVANSQMRLSGGDPTFVYGIGKAFSRIHIIIMWGVISGTVGLLLKLLRQSGRDQKNPAMAILMMILAWLLEVAWWMTTFFVIPVMIMEGRGLRETIKNSKELFSGTWGTNIAAGLGIDLIGFMFLVLSVLIGVGIGMVAGPALGFGIGAILVVLTIMWVAAANTVAISALYIFAKTGQMPSLYQEKGMATFQF